MEEDFLGEKHKHVFKDPELNSTNFRTIYYPPLTGLSETGLADGVVRCGQHADYATITLLMQDEMGGLEATIYDRLSYILCTHLFFMIWFIGNF